MFTRPTICIVQRRWPQPLEFRCFLVYKLRYTLFHIHFRLQATIFDEPPILTWRVMFTIILVSEPQKQQFPLEICWFLIRIVRCYIPSVSRHFEFVWAWLLIFRHLRYQRKCARALQPVKISENRIIQLPYYYHMEVVLHWYKPMNHHRFNQNMGTKIAHYTFDVNHSWFMWSYVVNQNAKLNNR